MLKQYATFFRRLMIIADLVLVALSFFIAYRLRQGIDPLAPIEGCLLALLALTIIWGVCLYLSGIYNSFRLKKITEVLYLIYQSAYFSFFIFASLCYLLRLEHVSRALVSFTFVFCVIFLAAEKTLLMIMFRRLRKTGFNFRNVIIAGSGPRAQKFLGRIAASPELGLKIIGIVDNLDPRPETVNGQAYLGDFSEIPEILRHNPVDHMIFVVPRSMLNRIDEPIRYCETLGVTVSLATDFFSLKLTSGKETSFLGFPFLNFETTPNNLWKLLVKRVTDIIFSTSGLVVLSPLMLATAAAVKLTSPGPVFFRQVRCTLNRRKFVLYKFRTMVDGADAKKDELLSFNEMQGPAFKMENDPRVTPLGRFLRKYSIDELPQLWNVLKGDMSLVGPRPPIDTEVKQYDHWQMRRLSMRPGITCIWQTTGRNKIRSMDEWARLDLQYIDNWSPWLDFVILLKTIPVVLAGTGAK